MAVQTALLGLSRPAASSNGFLSARQRWPASWAALFGIIPDFGHQTGQSQQQCCYGRSETTWAPTPSRVGLSDTDTWPSIRRLVHFDLLSSTGFCCCV